MQTNQYEADVSLAEAQEMFNRMLQSWASDVLSLQRRGLDKPSYRTGRWCEQAATGPWPFAEVKVRRAKAA